MALLLLAFAWGCTAVASGKAQESANRTPPGSSNAGILYFRNASKGPIDLWIQSLDGKQHRPLTSSGQVVILPSVGSAAPGHWGGAAISPDGRQVAYVEHRKADASLPSKRRGPVGIWNTLFVVNTDGTARRVLVDLTQQPVPEGEVRAGSIIWSDDGRSIAYVLETHSSETSDGNCSRVTIQAVDVASGLITTLSEPRPLGFVTLLGWTVARGEIALYGVCAQLPSEDISFPIPEGRFIVMRPGDGTLRQQDALAPSLSPDGAVVFIPSQPRTRAPPLLYRTDALSPSRAIPLSLPPRYEGRITWMHRSPSALVTATHQELPFEECVGTNPQPRMLFRLEVETGTLQMMREESRELNIVAVSPDDTYALVGILTGKSLPAALCGSFPLEALSVVRLEDLSAEMPTEALRRRALLLTEPREWMSVNAFPEYVGWVR